MEEGKGKNGFLRMLKSPVLLIVAIAVVLSVVVAVKVGRDQIGALRTESEQGVRENAAGDREWAEAIELAGVANLHRVSEDLYRGAQPTAEGMQNLEAMGIRTIVNLRSFHSDRDEIGDANLAYEHMTMKPWHPEDKEVVEFLEIVADAQKRSVFVHCQRGADRTGTICAIYRVAVEGWSKDEAIDEMVNGGFGFYEGWEGLIEYIRELDVERLKGEAGLE